MNKKQRFIWFIEKLSVFSGGHLMGLLLLVLMVMILAEVLTRYVLQSPMSIAEEYGGYMMVAVTFFGLSYTWKEHGHVRVELFIQVLPAKAQRWLRLITLIMAVAFTVVMIKAGYDLVSQSHMFGSRSDTLHRTPVMWPQLTIIIGAVLLFFQLVVEIIKAVADIKTPRRKV